MPKIKLTTFERVFVPDVDFQTDEGTINNRNLPNSDQVKSEITLATVSQKTKYLGSYSVMKTSKKNKKKADVKSYTEFDYDSCVSRHCSKITGLEEYNITDGKTLVSHKPLKELNEIIQQIFLKVNGVHDDDDLSDEFENDGSGELAEGEN